MGGWPSGSHTAAKHQSNQAHENNQSHPSVGMGCQRARYICWSRALVSIVAAFVADGTFTVSLVSVPPKLTRLGHALAIKM